MAERKERIYTIVAIGMLLFMAGFMLAFASKQSFWFDEVEGTIGLITYKRNVGDRSFKALLLYLLGEGNSLPLYLVIMKPLYELLPYGETYLSIPSIVFAILGIMITAKAGKIIDGIDTGFFAACIAVGSGTLIAYGWEIRPYTMTFCVSSLALLMYIKRLKQETNKNMLIYGISLVLLLYSHWFGSILALSYALIDLFLFLRKKISLKCIFSYIGAGILFFPWVFMMISTHTKKYFLNHWAPIPGDIEPIKTVLWLLSNSIAYLLLFDIGFNLTLFKLALFKGARENEKKVLDVSRIWFFISISIVWTILLVYVYSRYINPKGSLYVNRYFLVIMPHVFLITAYGFAKTFYAIQSNFFRTVIKKKILYCILIALFCFSVFRAYQKPYSDMSLIFQPYREVSELLSKDEQITSANTLVMNNGWGWGWIEYYFSKRGFDIPANVAETYDYRNFYLFIYNGQWVEPKIVMSDEDILRFDVIYFAQWGASSYLDSENFMAIIEENYNTYQVFHRLYCFVKKRR